MIENGQERSRPLKPTPEKKALGEPRGRWTSTKGSPPQSHPHPSPTHGWVSPRESSCVLRRLYPHTKPQPRGRRAREAGDSRGPGADEPPVRDHSTRIVDTKAPTMSQKPEPAEARPHHSQASTEHKKPATDYETQASVPRETTHPPHTSSPAVKSKCRVSLSRGSVRFERGGPDTV